MSIAMDSYCMECYLKRHLELVRPLGDEKKTTAFARRLMEMILQMPEGTSSPYLGPQVTALLQEMYGLPVDRFRQERTAANAYVLERMDSLRGIIQSADDPILAALKLAILGNYLDFNALRHAVDFGRLDEMIRSALDMELEEGVYSDLLADLNKGAQLLYLTDNAGEIGFDRLLAEEIAKKYPQINITFCDRGANAANDATREDAAAVGLSFPIIDNGNAIAGTQLDMLSREAEEAIAAADVILAKGMANVETMFGCGRNVYYAFLIKCVRFVRIFDRPLMTPMLVREDRR